MLCLKAREFSVELFAPLADRLQSPAEIHLRRQALGIKIEQAIFVDLDAPELRPEALSRAPLLRHCRLGRRRRRQGIKAMSEPRSMAKPAPAPIDAPRLGPAAVFVERFVISVTETAVFISLDGVSLSSPDGHLSIMPAFCAMMSPANAKALVESLSTALSARQTLAADTTVPQ